MNDPRIVIFAAGALLFGSLIVIQFSAGTADDVAVVPAAIRPDGDRAELPRTAPPADSLVATIFARPLFSPDRRPPAAPQGSGADLKDKRFAGIVIEPGRRLAIFAVTGAKPLAVTEGDSVDGWRIESITADEIALVSAQGSRTLRPTPAPAGEGRTQLRKIVARSSITPKKNAATETPQSDPRISIPAAVKPPVQTGAQPSANTQAPRTAQAPQPPGASQPVGSAPAGPRSTQPPSESQRNIQSSSATAGIVGQRP
jgi:general secretion pathway protein N